MRTERARLSTVTVRLGVKANGHRLLPDQFVLTQDEAQVVDMLVVDQGYAGGALRQFLTIKGRLRHAASSAGRIFDVNVIDGGLESVDDFEAGPSFRYAWVQ